MFAVFIGGKLAKKMRRTKKHQTPDLITAIKVVRKIREVMLQCNLLARLYNKPPLPGACEECAAGSYCLSCRRCRDEIIRQIARLL